MTLGFRDARGIIYPYRMTSKRKNNQRRVLCQLIERVLNEMIAFSLEEPALRPRQCKDGRYDEM